MLEVVCREPIVRDAFPNVWKGLVWLQSTQASRYRRLDVRKSGQNRSREGRPGNLIKAERADSPRLHEASTLVQDIVLDVSSHRHWPGDHEAQMVRPSGPRMYHNKRGLPGLLPSHCGAGRVGIASPNIDGISKPTVTSKIKETPRRKRTLPS
ncbi:hypothetical protein MYCTH_2307984 [Thermothelomyces thermophilus ATCC 42464]|uniref:Uncharacterized protein n=1 Tax=Thermothelomyces thermophilus (strain ATCC 42464 / BCRC 31852 / DSM 1799) TaxID=573729 RepID=G2QIU5_THET4|nr:uncharacterized protein MYCTH_2307984 [Thermothelomyces thermophilus ATCC 42464]AEO59573.1 hypothetical protein MYCTH_2307984 [Thermothelomyces thermophilus ATCC 42464]